MTKVDELMRLADEWADECGGCDCEHLATGSPRRAALKSALEAALNAAAIAESDAYLCGYNVGHEAALKDCRNATLEEAALKFDSMDTGGAGYFAEEPADILRSMKS